VLTNDSLNTRNLHKHLTTRHASLGNNPLEFFELILLQMQNQLNLMKTAVTTSEEALPASFEISYLIDKKA
jgi:hypothetical protein